MDHIIRERKDLRGAELTCALIIANYASVDDKCYPGIERIASDLRTSVRQTQVLIRRLERKKVFKIIVGEGRGHFTQFQFLKPEEINTFPAQEKVKESTPFSADKRRSFEYGKGEVLRQEKVKFCASYIKEEPLREPKENPKREDPPASAFGPPRNVPQDLRFYHPALKAIRDLTGHNPDKVLWDALIEILGLEVDVGRLKNCFSAWVLKGYKKSNYSWITDWYVNGIPKNGTNNKPTTEREKSGERAVANELFMQDLERRIANGDNPFLSDGDDENHIAGYLVS